MPDLAMELSHLEQANRHIAQAKENIARISERLTTSRGTGTPDAESIARLETLKATLVAFEDHRALIVRSIQDIRDGKFR